MKTIIGLRGFYGTMLKGVDHLSNRVLVNETETYKFYRRLKNKYGVTVTLTGDYVPVNKFKKIFHYPTVRLGTVTTLLNSIGYKVNIKDLEPIKGNELNLNMLSDKEPRDYQIPVIDKIVNATLGESILVCLPTGTGKTFSSCYALQKANRKFMVYVLARYVDKWKSDIREMYDIDDDEMYVIVGKKSFEKLFNMSQDDLDNIKVYICSNRTMYSYLKDYLNTQDDLKFKIDPNIFLEYIGVNTILIDEAHQEFENVFRTMVILNPNYLIGLSATFYPTDPEQGKMYNMLFPKTDYIGNIEVKAYTDMYAISYTLSDDKIKHAGTFGYSHVELEKSIFRNRRMLKNYTNMVVNIIKKFYSVDYKAGDKFLIYFSTVKMVEHMCNAIDEVLTSEMPNVQLNIATYISGDDYSVIQDADGIVSTLGKASTALDIPNLTTVLMTVILGSESMNHQAFGRLRDLKEYREKFIFLYANNLSTHRYNATKKIELLNYRIRNLKRIPYKGTI